MKFWERLGKSGQRLTLISSILVILSGGGFSINKGIRWAKNYAHVPVVADSLDREMILMWEVLQIVHDDQKELEQANEMMWHLHMANTSKHGNRDYFLTFADGRAIDVFIRDDHLRPPEQWIFYKMCEDGYCKYKLFQGKWSGVYDKFYFVDFGGQEHLIYER